MLLGFAISALALLLSPTQVVGQCPPGVDHPLCNGDIPIGTYTTGMTTTHGPVGPPSPPNNVSPCGHSSHCNTDEFCNFDMTTYGFCEVCIDDCYSLNTPEGVYECGTRCPQQMANQPPTSSNGSPSGSPNASPDVQDDTTDTTSDDSMPEDIEMTMPNMNMDTFVLAKKEYWFGFLSCLLVTLFSAFLWRSCKGYFLYLKSIKVETEKEKDKKDDKEERDIKLQEPKYIVVHRNKSRSKKHKSKGRHHHHKKDKRRRHKYVRDIETGSYSSSSTHSYSSDDTQLSYFLPNPPNTPSKTPGAGLESPVIIVTPSSTDTTTISVVESV